MLTTSSVAAPAEATSDGLVTVLSIVALLASAVAFGLVFWVYSSSGLS